MMPDGSQATEVLNDSADHLSAIGDSIYFSNAGHLYKKVLGKEYPQPSLISSAPMPYVFAASKQVYYANDGGLFVDGDGFLASKQIIGNPKNAFINSGYIYYQPASVMGPHPIHRVAMDGTGDTVIVEDDVKSFSISGNQFFYISYDNGKIYSAKLDGTDIKEVTSDAAGTLNVHNGWIYYSNKGDGSKLYKIRVDSSSRTKLSDQDEIASINIVGDWVFYSRGLSVTSLDSSVYMMKLDGSEQRTI